MNLMRIWRRLRGRRTGAGALREQAGHARGQGRLRDAAVLYEAADRLSADPHARIQAAHMYKEAGDHDAAERHYLAAFEALPKDADLALQLGHFYKVAGRTATAAKWYQRAVALHPGWSDASAELDRLGIAADDENPEGLEPHSALTRRRGVGNNEAHDRVLLRHFGGQPLEHEPIGMPALRGVESIRGVVVSMRMLERIELLINGEHAGFTALVRSATVGEGARKFVFNIWHDFTAGPMGPCTIELRVFEGEAVDGVGARAAIRLRREAFVGAPRHEVDYPGSDAVVDAPPAAAMPLDQWLHQRPSIITPARPNYFANPPKSILAIRADQLGDMVVSVPAFRRLRAIAPDAKIVVLVTPANADLARSLGLFDAVEVMDWDASAVTDERRMTVTEERRVKAALKRHRPDVAIDLSVAASSRPLLRLSGAPCTIGFTDPASPWLTVDVDGRSHDVRTGHEMAPHAARLFAPVDRLASLIHGGGEIMPNPAAAAATGLEAIGLPSGGYAVLHTGGRFQRTRWPHYAELARRLCRETEWGIVILGTSDDLAEDMLADRRVRVVDQLLPFADLDALLSGAAMFVGGDSGPKHLAAFRGTAVVSLHSVRVDRREWGQTQTGLIISRRLPCAGCSLHGRQEDECGRNYACITDIAVDEVVAAVRSLLPQRLAPMRPASSSSGRP